MKHLNNYISESIFDDQGTSDQTVFVEALKKLFDMQKLNVEIDGSTLRLLRSNGRSSIYMCLEGDLIEKGWDMVPGLDSIYAEGFIEISGLKNFNKYIRSITSDTMSIGGCTGVENCVFTSKGAISIYRCTEFKNCEFNVTGPKNAYTPDIILIGVGESSNKITITNLKTNVDCIGISGFKEQFITSSSPTLHSIDIKFDTTFPPVKNTFYKLVRDLNPYETRRVYNKLAEYKDSGELGKMDPAADLGIGGIKNLDFINWYDFDGHGLTMYFYKPAAEHDMKLRKKIRSLNHEYECAGGWTLGFDDMHELPSY